MSTSEKILGETNKGDFNRRRELPLFKPGPEQRGHCPNCGFRLPRSTSFRFGNVRVSPFSIEFEGQQVSIARTQFVLVEELIRAQGRYLTRDFLAHELSMDILDKAVCQYVKRARMAFVRIKPSFDQIETLRGFSAYRWRRIPDQFETDWSG